jgi:hypothetical protein
MALFSRYPLVASIRQNNRCRPGWHNGRIDEKRPFHETSDGAMIKSIAIAN